MIIVDFDNSGPVRLVRSVSGVIGVFVRSDRLRSMIDSDRLAI